MIFEDVNKAEVELLLSNHKQVPASSLLYLINYAGLTDRYMERNNISVTWDNIGNLMLYHKLYNSLPSVGIRLKEPHEDLIKGVLLCKITNRDFLFSESNFKEDCKRYSKEYRSIIEERLYPLVMPCNCDDPLENLEYASILRGLNAKEITLDQEKVEEFLGNIRKCEINQIRNSHSPTPIREFDEYNKDNPTPIDTTDNEIEWINLENMELAFS